jgi:regulator of replication initiation timing
MGLARGLAVGLAVFMAGCDSQTQDSTESEVKALQSRCASLKRETENLKASIDTLKAENTAMDRKVYGLKTENAQLKRQLETALAAARPATPARPATATKTTDNSGAPPPGTTVVMGGAIPVPGAAVQPAGANDQTPAGLEKTVADLEARIAVLRPKITQNRGKLTDLVRSSIDQQTPVPSGGVVNGGVVYRKESLIVAPYYQFIPVGPAVRKGDFRTQQEKDDAIRRARDEAAPLEQEFKSLQAEQVAAKVKLLKFKAAAQTPGQPTDQPPGDKTKSPADQAPARPVP